MEQIEAIWDATLVGERLDAEHKIFLYQIDSFYVEVYHHIEYDVMRRIRSFSSIEQLKPYTDQIDLEL